MKLSDQITRRQLFVAFGTSQQTGSLSSVDLAATSDASAVTLSASDGSVAPLIGADASKAGVMTAADKVRLDGLPPTTVRDFDSFSEVPGAAVAGAITHLRTAGHASGADGGGGLYRRVLAEPSHAGKVQSADGAWWELVAQGGRILAEQIGAVGKGATDDTSAMQNAIDTARALNATLVAKGLYLVSSTLVWARGKHGFEGPAAHAIGAAPAAGFVWGGGSNDVMLEFSEPHFSHFQDFFLSAQDSAATGITAMRFRSPTSTVSAANHNYFGRITLSGFDIGLQIGDWTNDGYDSNFDDNMFEYVGGRDVATLIVVDSAAQDNNWFGRVHGGGPAGGPTKGTRDHCINIKRNGNGFHIHHGFLRTDGITADNAAIKVSNGGFSCDYLSFEGGTTARLIDLDGNSSRDQSVLRKVVSTDIADSSGRAMILNSKSGTVLLGCSVDGDIECNHSVVAIDTVFEGSADFTGSALSSLLALHTLRRTGPGSTGDANPESAGGATFFGSGVRMGDGGTLTMEMGSQAVASDQDNFAIAAAGVVRMSPTGSVAISGFDGGWDGRTVTILNTAGYGGATITLQQDNAASLSNNRFRTVTNADVVIGGQEVGMAIYDGTTLKWRAWKP